MEIPRPGSRIEIVAAMRRVRVSSIWPYGELIAAVLTESFCNLHWRPYKGRHPCTPSRLMLIIFYVSTTSSKADLFSRVRFKGGMKLHCALSCLGLQSISWSASDNRKQNMQLWQLARHGFYIVYHNIKHLNAEGPSVNDWTCMSFYIYYEQNTGSFFLFLACDSMHTSAVLAGFFGNLTEIFLLRCHRGLTIRTSEYETLWSEQSGKYSPTVL